MDKTDLSLILSALGLLVGVAGLLIGLGAGQFLAGIVTGLSLGVATWPLLTRRTRGDP